VHRLQTLTEHFITRPSKGTLGSGIPIQDRVILRRDHQRLVDMIEHQGAPQKRVETTLMRIGLGHAWGKANFTFATRYLTSPEVPPS
jgi:hypothetical protein